MRISLVTASLVLAASTGLGNTKPGSPVSEPISYSGICGASAAAALNSDQFVVADDEGNTLRVYDRAKGGPPLTLVNLTAHLELRRGEGETDIEGAAKMGDVIFWITSHSRNKNGKLHDNRARFFATSVKGTGTASISFVGRPYKHLITDLTSAAVLRPLNLAAASRLAPKDEGGLNIEGLCATPDNTLLIGFRNPNPGGKALLVPLLNPHAVVTGQRAIFGAPIQLDLRGLGVRDLGYWKGEYRIIAGSADGGGKSRLFSWSGGASRPKQLKEVDLKGLNPEALVIYPDIGLDQIQLLSDDSGRKGCQELPPASRHFRSVLVTLESEE